jgi:hypothetical protein
MDRFPVRVMLAACFHAGFLLRLFLDPEDGGDMSLRNVIDTQRTTRRYIPQDSTLLCLPPAFMVVSCSSYFSTLKMEAICPSETSLTLNGLRGVLSQKIALCSACHRLSRWFLVRLIFRPWRWRRYFPPKRRLTSSGLHGVISQNIILFISTVVRTSNPTYVKLD